MAKEWSAFDEQETDGMSNDEPRAALLEWLATFGHLGRQRDGERQGAWRSAATFLATACWFVRDRAA